MLDSLLDSGRSEKRETGDTGTVFKEFLWEK